MKAAALIAALVALAVSATPAFAAPPANDQFENAVPVSALPFAGSVDITEATRQSFEPPHGCYGAPQHTVWYRLGPLSASTLRVRASSATISDVSISIYRDQGYGLGGLAFVNCGSGPSPEVNMDPVAGETYYVQIGNSFSAGAVIDVSIAAVPAPSNDDVADATSVTSMPLTESVDVTAATTEVGEPVPSCFYSGGKSIWYSITPPVATHVTVTVGAPDLTTTAIYDGDPLAGGAELACRTYSGPLTFLAPAGASTLIRVAAFGPRTVDVRIEVAPDPVADITWYPEEPSMFDTVNFYSASTDPGGNPWSAFTWGFGDGSSGTDCCVQHRYSEDGDYLVTHRVTTTDGRSDDVSRTIRVRTHDVGIGRIVAPTSARVGQTKRMTVEVVNPRYPERVEVQLYRMAPAAGGNYYELVGTLELPVPVKRLKVAASFDFDYLVRQEDGVAGKVTFKAVARIVDHGDALPGDNETSSSQIAVKP